MKTKILSFLSEGIKKDVKLHSKINLIRKIMLLLLLGCLSQYGLSINPVDPPTKSGDNVITITPTSPVTTEECSELFTLVNVKITVTFTDCPNYKCSFPYGCTFAICIYDASYNLVDCQTFTSSTCDYIFNERMQDNQTISAHLVLTSGSCTGYNQGYPQVNIPIGGGDVYISTTFCP